MAAKARPYVTVLRAPSAVRLVGEAETLIVEATGAHGGDGYLRITNVPRGAEWHLRFEVRALATDMEDAQETLGSLASRFAVALGLAAHASVGMLDLTACYCADPDGGPRPFVRDMLYDGRAGSIAPRDLDGDLGAQVAAALWDAGERIERAAWHFVRALEVWEPRLLAPSAGHLWIAAETLGPVAEKNCVAASRVGDWRALAERWGLEAEYEGQLHAKTTNEALARVVFGGDYQLLKDLREFANGWEHGYQSFGTVRDQAQALVEHSARTIRAQMLNLLDLRAADRAALGDGLFDAPVGLWSPAVRVAGTIDGTLEVFAPFAEPVEPLGTVDISAEPALPPAWRTTSFSTNLDASAGHPEGAVLALDEHTLIAPSGRPTRPPDSGTEDTTL